MSEEGEVLTQEDVFANDLDPAEAIAAIRREESREAGSDELKTGPSEEELAAFAAAEDEEGLSSAEKLEELENADTDKTEVESEDKSVIKLDDDKSGDKTPDPEVKDEDKGEEEEKEEDKNEELGKADEIKTKSFKANGKDFTFTEAEMMEQFEGVFGKAMDYTQKMQKIAPFRKMISALEEQNITQDQFNLALDILKGDKGALKQLAQDKKIDLSDLSFEDEENNYKPTDYGDSDFQTQIKDIESQIGKDVEYTTTVDIIDNQWDDASRQLIADNPNVIMGLHNDVKSGVYDKIAPEALKLKLQDGNSKSDLDYYLLAGSAAKEITDSETNQNTVKDLNKGAQEADDKFSKESSEAEQKRAAGKTASAAGKKGVVDYLDDDNDEKYDAWYKNLMASS